METILLCSILSILVIVLILSAMILVKKSAPVAAAPAPIVIKSDSCCPIPAPQPVVEGYAASPAGTIKISEWVYMLGLALDSYVGNTMSWLGRMQGLPGSGMYLPYLKDIPGFTDPWVTEAMYTGYYDKYFAMKNTLPPGSKVMNYYGTMIGFDADNNVITPAGSVSGSVQFVNFPCNANNMCDSRTYCDSTGACKPKMPMWINTLASIGELVKELGCNAPSTPVDSATRLGPVVAYNNSVYAAKNYNLKRRIDDGLRFQAPEGDAAGALMAFLCNKSTYLVFMTNSLPPEPSMSTAKPMAGYMPKDSKNRSNEEGLLILQAKTAYDPQTYLNELLGVFKNSKPLIALLFHTYGYDHRWKFNMPNIPEGIYNRYDGTVVMTAKPGNDVASLDNALIGLNKFTPQGNTLAGRGGMVTYLKQLLDITESRTVKYDFAKLATPPTLDYNFRKGLD